MVDNMAGNMDMADNMVDRMVGRMDRLGKTGIGAAFSDVFHNCHNHSPGRIGHNIA